MYEYDIVKVINGFTIVRKKGGNTFNIIRNDTKEFLIKGKKWLGLAEYLGNVDGKEYFRIYRKGSYNIINEDGEYVFNVKIRELKKFVHGLALIKFGDDANCNISEGSNIENDYEVVKKLRNGISLVKATKGETIKYNYLNTEGKLLSETWFDDAFYFYAGFAMVELNEQYNYLNAEGKLLSEMWFDYASYFREGFAAIGINGKYNYLNTEGKLLSDTWFDNAHDFNEGFAVVEIDEQYNFISTKGKFLSDTWFEYAYNFDEGLASVWFNGGQCHRLNRSGRIVY
jgi:hypothetical protein